MFKHNSVFHSCLNCGIIALLRKHRTRGTLAESLVDNAAAVEDYITYSKGDENHEF